MARIAPIARLRRPTLRRGVVAVALLGLITTGCAPLSDLSESTVEEKVADQAVPDVDADAMGVEGGLLVDAASPYDVDLPAIANLDPGLLAAVQQAADAAAADEITMVITSGWRSEAFQRSLFDGAVSRYGSEEEAARYVSSPEISRHVTGTAVDIGPTDADSWLSQHGADYGLCQTYANEMWHFELATTPGGVCPEMLPDASHG